MSKVMALCSCPRLGYMDFMGVSIVAFATNNCEYKNLFGVYWGQALGSGMQTTVEDGYDYIITTDYDSVISTETVAQLIRLAEQNPHADAICAMQMGRFSGLLASTESGTMSKKELKTEPLVPVNTGHFGLTIFRVSVLKEVAKPWFWSKPGSDGEWGRYSDKLDEDVFFWDNFKASGKQLYLAPRLVIGHLELLIKYPGEDLEGIYETLSEFHENGPPRDVWK